MYGLENSAKKPFQFDLEIDLHKHPEKAKDLLKQVEEKISAVKGMMKSASKQESEELTTLLQGYIALQAVLKRINTRK